MARVSIYSKEGYFVGDLRTATVRSWTLASTGVYGKCSFDMSKLDPKTSLKYLDFGKYILVREANLPDWIGVIYTDQSWRHGDMTVKAWQAEKILAWRPTPTDELIADQAGELFREILTITNAITFNEKPIMPGEIFSGGTVREETLGDDALTHIQSIAERSGNDFEVAHVFDVNGRLTLKGNWFERMGRDTDEWLREGHNIEYVDDILNIKGDLYNEVTGYMDASTKGTRGRITMRDEAAIARWGYYGKSKAFSGVSQQSTLEENTIDELLKTVQGQSAVKLNALNVGDTFSTLRIGNTRPLDLNGAGFDGAGYGFSATVRILGMTRDDLVDRVQLVVEVVDA